MSNEEWQRKVNNPAHEHDNVTSHTCGCGKIAWSVAKDGSHVAHRPTCGECARGLEKKGEI